MPAVPVRLSRFWAWIGAFDRTETGKYLFFGPDAAALVDLGKYLISHCGFRYAKVSRHARGPDHVLCVYWKDDARKWELAELHEQMDLEEDQGIKYRYWKSNEDTRRGKYSNPYKKVTADARHAAEDAQRQYDDNRYAGLFDESDIPF